MANIQRAIQSLSARVCYPITYQLKGPARYRCTISRSHHTNNDSTVQQNLSGLPLDPSIEVQQYAYVEKGSLQNESLSMLEESIKKSDAATSQFSNYMYDFKSLPKDYGSNQFIHMDLEFEKSLHNVLNTFNAPIDFAFGYGSGVFKQNTQAKVVGIAPQIDMIFGVRDAFEFHKINLKQNPQHYSSLRYFGAKIISKFQHIGAGIYFNPFTNINGLEVKYGVVSMEDLLRDLSQWNTFYLAGRLHKPVKILKNDIRVQFWNQLNLKGAATLAKNIMLRDNNGKMNERKFFEAIAGLSYLGDFRFKLGGEHPNKVKNIVKSNLSHFKTYYAPIYKDVVLNNSFYLPKGFTLDNARTMIASRTRKYSSVQTVKGAFTAGLTKSVRYAWAKKMKALRKN